MGTTTAAGSRNSRRRNRNRDRYRDRNDRNDRGDRRRPWPSRQHDVEPTINEDDVLIPVAGILDLLDNYAFVRTSGYLPGPNDVYVALSMVRKYGLRKGDAITGAVRQIRRATDARSSTRWCASTPSTAPSPRRPRTGSSSAS